MIPRRYIQEWKSSSGWVLDSQIEQDLVISRAIAAIFSNDFLRAKLAFRGGTALYKLYVTPAPRYSEDIDMVQIQAGPIKEIIDPLREVLSFLGKPAVRQKADNNTMLFHFDSEIPPVARLKLKVEINCREHFSVIGYKEVTFSVSSGWFNGNCIVNTYHFDELIGTKLRALYQRKKGRDLYDIYKALCSEQSDSRSILKCYRKYMMASVGKMPSKKEFLKNIEAKINDPDFLTDVEALLKPGEIYNSDRAFELIKKELIVGM
ncbi:nucleotidyl transferase AbiEii/AbiGii toxin family protein [bacterium]|nr:nucleotidyl transferase AbiEii/AbiGii toxin family protein [bacterium]MBU3930618.1 nucleotidyl transferase AbiEii/AbiGii toxin family protein [bacterium]